MKWPINTEHTKKVASGIWRVLFSDGRMKGVLALLVIALPVFLVWFPFWFLWRVVSGVFNLLCRGAMVPVFLCGMVCAQLINFMEWYPERGREHLEWIHKWVYAVAEFVCVRVLRIRMFKREKLRQYKFKRREDIRTFAAHGIYVDRYGETSALPYEEE